MNGAAFRRQHRERMVIEAMAVLAPGAANVTDLEIIRPYEDVRAVNGAIVTSDERDKHARDAGYRRRLFAPNLYEAELRAGRG